ncbi:hypothetical protein CSZ94_19860 [Janthinobacterium sp. ROICE36]|nr:hypothetical protein [Janthinobacterium sp. ROICE36]PLY40647.1 hypothetical protein CSZ94_19860 [Janthinobacterium sp. ROICE36]
MAADAQPVAIEVAEVSAIVMGVIMGARQIWDSMLLLHECKRVCGEMRQLIVMAQPFPTPFHIGARDLWRAEATAPEKTEQLLYCAAHSALAL